MQNNLYPLVGFKRECFQEYHDECSLVLWCYDCNFHCSWCSMKSLIYDKSNIIKENYLSLITTATKMESAVVFLGGEPTLYAKGLELGCNLARDVRLKTKIFTNGSNMQLIYNLCKNKLLDAISIDYKEFDYTYAVVYNLISGGYLPPENIDLRITMHTELSEKDINQMKLNAESTGVNVYLQRYKNNS